MVWFAWFGWFVCAGLGFRDSVMEYHNFQEFSPVGQGGLNLLLLSSWNSRLLGLREGSYGQLNTNTTRAVIKHQKCAELGMFGLCTDRGSVDDPTGAPRTLMVIGIDPKQG